jgi:hypothetical protein
VTVERINDMINNFENFPLYKSSVRLCHYCPGASEASEQLCI